MAAPKEDELSGHSFSPWEGEDTKPESDDMKSEKCDIKVMEAGDALALKQEPSDDPSSPLSDKRDPGGGKIKRNKDSKTCGVCGDKALGCNFDAISCESCKAFFRRNALKTKKSKCLFTGNCRIDVNTRRFCPHCRLSKCLSVGMKKDLILGENERKKRMDKVKNNRRRKVKSTDDPDTPSMNDAGSPQEESPVRSPSPSLTSPSLTSPSPSINSQQNGNDSLLIGNPPTPMTISAPNTPMPTSPGSVSGQVELTTAQINTCNLLTLMSARGPSIGSDYNNLLTNQTFLRKLTPEENIILTELEQVYDLSFIVDLEPLVHIKHIDPTINQLVNQSSITVLRIIKFAKRLEEFTKLPQECQIGILKCTWIHILLLRSVSLYDTMRDVWVTPKGEIPSEILKNATGFVKLHEDHVTFSKAFKEIIENDLPVVIILLAIVLFSPEGPHVTYRDVVSNIQDKYLLLLKHYLEARYSFARAADMFPRLMYKIKELKDLGEGHGKYLLHVDPTEIEPIMLEILDLK